MICLLLLFCSSIVGGNVPLYDGAVSRYGNVLLAHNYLDGQYFSQIETGDMLRYYDGKWMDYKVTDIIEAQAAEPSLTTPLLIDGLSYSPRQIHETIYQNDLVLQTCIYKDGDLSWGRLFVIAEHYGK